MHQHECDACHTVWQHGEECHGDKAAHTCPTCGQMQWWKRLPSSMSESCKALFNAVRVFFESSRA
jgi:NAD-dependent SIR2 family protein deacetylase